MKTEDLIPHEFFRQFKTGEELNNFLKSIQKCGIEKMLEGELDAHLDYDKHSHRKEDNSRNGYSKKTGVPNLFRHCITKCVSKSTAWVWLCL